MARQVIRKYQLKTLDGLQLAAAILAKPDVFVSSDQALLKKAGKELGSVMLI